MVPVKPTPVVPRSLLQQTEPARQRGPLALITAWDLLLVLLLTVVIIAVLYKYEAFNPMIYKMMSPISVEKEVAPDPSV